MNVDAVCAFARTGRYQVTGPEDAITAYQQILVVSDGGRQSAILAERDYPEFAKAPPGYARRLMTIRAKHGLSKMPDSEPNLRISLDSSGQATGCVLSSTVGSDAADIAICRLVRNTRDFVPGRDQFGRKQDSGVYLSDWLSNPDGDKR